MTSPDFRRYLDLTVYDQQPGDIYSDAIEYGVVALPEFNVRQGTIEDALLQAMSFVAGQVIASINRLPNGLMQGILEIMGFNRVESQRATATAYFTVIDSLGAEFPVGVIIGYTEDVEGGTIVHLFRTLAKAVAGEGETSTNAVAIEALEPGKKPDLTAGTQMQIYTNSSKLLASFLSTDLVNGGEPETDEQYFGRAVTYLASLSGALVTTNQINAFVATNYKQAVRSKSYDLTNFFSITPSALERSTDVVTATVATGHGVVATDVIRIHSANTNTFNGYFVVTSVGDTEISWSQTGADVVATNAGVLENLERARIDGEDEVGYVTVYVSGTQGASLTAEEKNPIQLGLSERVVVGLQTLIRDAILVNVTTNITIKILPGYDSVVVEQAVDTYLTEILSPDQWDWSPRIRKNAIIARASQIVGIDYVEDFEFVLDENEVLAEIDVLTGDVVFIYEGMLPVPAVEVSVL